MDVVLLFNGLGNQMSQYAFYLKKKQVSRSTRFIFERKSRSIHNGYELYNVFGIPLRETVLDRMLYFLYLGLAYKKARFISQPANRLLGRLGFRVYNESDNYNFQPQMLHRSRGIRFYAGGWHSDRYFRDIKDQVLRAFEFDRSKLGAANEEMLQRIKVCRSVSVHIRRGDFLDANNYSKFGSVCTLNYFLTAIEKVRSMAEGAHFFFFTNDHAWVRENFQGTDVTVVDINKAGDSWKDMFLISQCEHNINSNGTFSWWSAYLNRNPEKIVIVPRNFLAGIHFEDIYPEEWIQLSDY
ncbi:MAG TPA: alpha-1,2-fucosyltransferase [Puia sp.]|uniref:alpha-1,2-fucosyltransferase n=1 Tax=Puia sp. TaxID=2045100 RepID=UPI002CC47965|nr:alpha-1,2-fucosyltransferase [Puia sp.]HVU96489.1 alpha-1,2-fucosyltransferase [Puia sp.]